MKKALVALSLAALFAGSAAATDPVTSSSVVFQGSVIAKTCTIDNGGMPMLNVGLPTVWTSDVKPEAGKTPFTINVSGCAEFPGKTVELKFQPTQGTVVEGLLQNTRNTNVGLKVTDAEGQNVLEGEHVRTIELTKSNSYDPTVKHSFEYNVEYAKTNDQPAQAGQVVAVLPFSIEYK